MKFIGLLWNKLFGKKNNQIETNSDDYLTQEYNDWIKLEEEKQEAIRKCKGEREKVFILKKNGEEISYACSIHSLAVKNNLPPRSLYHYWDSLNKGKKDPKVKYSRSNPKYKGKYEITKLE